jgi:hypothetical protein
MSVPRTRIALLAAVVLLAGCAGAGAQPYTETGEALNGTELRQSHTENLESAGSFTSSFNASYAAGEGRTTINLTTRVDGEADRALQQTRLNASGSAVSGVLETATYTDGDTTYRQRTLDTDGGTTSSYDSGSAPYDGSVQPVNTTAARFADALGDIDRVNWTQSGVEQYDGTAVTRYEAEGLEAFLNASAVAVPGADTPTEEPSVGSGEVIEARATMLVTGDGTVRLLEVAFVAEAGGDRTTVSYRISVDDVGSTTVEEPAWTDRVDSGQQAAVR